MNDKAVAIDNVTSFNLKIYVTIV